eukprot:COSAG01_NODE_15538_length_1325_cov_4.712887_2_plen_138_part_00
MRRRRQVQAEQQEERFAADIERRRAWREEQLQAQQQEDEARAVRRHSCWRQSQASSCFPILLRRPLVWQTGGVMGALITAVRVSLAFAVWVVRCLMVVVVWVRVDLVSVRAHAECGRCAGLVYIMIRNQYEMNGILG